jgi:hypothetical protein
MLWLFDIRYPLQLKKISCKLALGDGPTEDPWHSFKFG